MPKADNQIIVDSEAIVYAPTHHVTDGVHCQHGGKCMTENRVYLPWDSYRKVTIPDGRYMIVEVELLGTCWPERFTDADCPWCLSLTELNVVSDARRLRQVIGGTFQIQSAHFSTIAMDFAMTANQAAWEIEKFAKALTALTLTLA